jgi:hypothetical protein
MRLSLFEVARNAPLTVVLFQRIIANVLVFIQLLRNFRKALIVGTA